MSRRDFHRARRDSRLWAASAGGRSGLVSPVFSRSRILRTVSNIPADSGFDILPPSPPRFLSGPYLIADGPIIVTATKTQKITPDDFANVRSGSFAPGGGWFAGGSSAGFKGLWALWDLSTEPYTEITSKASVPGNSQVTRFSRNGAFVAIGHLSSPFFSIYEMSSDTMLSGIGSAPGIVRGAAWSANDEVIALACGNDGLAVFDVATKTYVSGWPTVSGTGYSCAWSPDGARLAVATTVGLLVIDVESATTETGWPLDSSDCRAVAWSFDGTRLAVGLADAPKVAIIDVESKSIQSGWPDALDTATSVNGVAWNSDATKLALAHTSVGSRFTSVWSATTKTVETGWPNVGSGLSVVWAYDTGNITSG
jgi:WD40 repeat protein